MVDPSSTLAALNCASDPYKACMLNTHVTVGLFRESAACIEAERARADNLEKRLAEATGLLREISEASLVDDYHAESLALRKITAFLGTTPTPPTVFQDGAFWMMWATPPAEPAEDDQ